MRPTLVLTAALAALALGPPPASAGPPEGRSPLETVAPGIVDGPTGAALAKAGAVVVDVRTPQEYAAGHVEGAINIPFDELPRRAAEIGPPTTPIVLYCRSGHRAGIAAAALRAAGYARLWDAQRFDTWPREPAQRGQ